MNAHGATPAFYKSAPGKEMPGSSISSASPESNPSKIFDELKIVLSEDLVKKVNGVFQFDLTGSAPFQKLL